MNNTPGYSRSGFELEGFRHDYRHMEGEVARRRVEAVAEIVGRTGFDGILKLADIVESPDRSERRLRKPNASQTPRFFLNS